MWQGAKEPQKEVWYPGASISRAVTTLRPKKWAQATVARSQKEKSLLWVEQGPTGRDTANPRQPLWVRAKGMTSVTSHSCLSWFLLGLPIGRCQPGARGAENLLVWPSVSHPLHDWYLGLDHSLLWRNLPVHCRMFNSIPGLYSLDDNSNFLSCDTPKCLHISNCPLRGQNCPNWEPLV